MRNNQTDVESSIRYFNISINLFYLIFGNVGNLLKIAFFLQKPLRSVPCTVYILFSTFGDLITLNNLPVLQLLIHLYPNDHYIPVTVDWSNHQHQTPIFSPPISTYDTIICKLRSYFHMLSTDLSFQMLLFASINRFCSTYRRRKRQTKTHYFIRHFCHYPHVYKLCLITSLITIILFFQHILNFTINSSSKRCVPYNRLLWVGWVIVFHSFLLPILMIIFGILTLKNIQYLSVFDDYFHRLQCRNRQRKHRFLERCSHCSLAQKSIQSQIDRQLTAMIITEILVTILTSIPYGIYAFYQLLRNIEISTMMDPNESVWIPLLIRTSMYFEPCCGFYIYLMTLTTLRKRFYKMLMKKIRRFRIYYWN